MYQLLSMSGNVRFREWCWLILGMAACDPRVAGAPHKAAAALPSASIHTITSVSATSTPATPTSAALPRPVHAVSRRTLDCGTEVGCSIGADLRVSCWGYNQFGQLGRGKLPYPQKGRGFVPIPPATSVSVGHNHVCALTTTGSVYCWGLESDGSIGDGILTPSESTQTRIVPPTKVELTAKVVDIDVAISHSCAVLEDGAVACWGSNHANLFGAGKPSTARPQRITGVSGAVEVATSEDQTCVRTAEGDVTCWERNADPARIDGVCARQLAMGPSGVCAIACGGGTWCWGNLLGYGNDPAPRPIAELADAAEVRACESHLIARDRNGNIFTWGTNDSGQIGNGKPKSWESAFANTPIQLKTQWKAEAVCAGYILSRPTPKHLRPASYLDTGTSCARTVDGKVYCWGEPDVDYVPKPVLLPK